MGRTPRYRTGSPTWSDKHPWRPPHHHLLSFRVAAGEPGTRGRPYGSHSRICRRGSRGREPRRRLDRAGDGSRCLEARVRSNLLLLSNVRRSVKGERLGPSHRRAFPNRIGSKKSRKGLVITVFPNTSHDAPRSTAWRFEDTLKNELSSVNCRSFPARRAFPGVFGKRRRQRKRVMGQKTMPEEEPGFGRAVFVVWIQEVVEKFADFKT